ncbi:MAG: hypothetical protein ABI607_11890 [Betaproteobacteria bacterium]
MKKILWSAISSVALGLTLAGCENKNAQSGQSNAVPAQATIPAPTATPAPARDPALPDPATAAAVKDAADKARAMPGKPPVDPNANPQKAMTKQEESTAMPMAGQVNDHSNTVLDKKKSP